MLAGDAVHPVEHLVHVGRRHAGHLGDAPDDEQPEGDVLGDVAVVVVGQVASVVGGDGGVSEAGVGAVGGDGRL